MPNVTLLASSSMKTILDIDENDGGSNGDELDEEVVTFCSKAQIQHFTIYSRDYYDIDLTKVDQGFNSYLC